MNHFELDRLDATDQALLVRTGQVSPLELVNASIDAIERINPAINAVIHERFEQARAEAAGDPPDGPFRGVPIVLKDMGCPVDRRPVPLGLTVSETTQLARRSRLVSHHEVPGGGFRERWAYERTGAGDVDDHRATGVWADPQPLEPRPFDRRLIRRLRRGGRRRARRDRPCQRRWRVASHSRERMRTGRTETDAGSNLSRPRPRRLVGRRLDRRRADAQRTRHGCRP